ncbi:hypothetical protein DBR32_03790 [Taibaiella sp. KBW10]|uniref:acetyltransferase n=1 Tax=Taibaiella sp. KBW10 TaxID=2153357 RepID=UPI000F59D1ED|nr:acetyltransferase [Taibaiella sp. KBW10]RQO31938.1 hypothetical protein DBR32_03790 [Taibaiella sp. KBW10]
MKRLAIIGAGHLGQQIAYHAIADKQYNVVGFFDDTHDKGSIINGIMVLGNIKEAKDSYEAGVFDELLIGIGYKHIQMRKVLFEQFSGKVPFATFIHSSCWVDASATIKQGVVMYSACVIDKHVVIEENVLLNIGCCIAHDTKIGKHSFLSPRVAIAGFVVIGELNILGINTTVIDNVSIVGNTQVGAAGVVIKNIVKPGLYVGNPVRFIR